MTYHHFILMISCEVPNDGEDLNRNSKMEKLSACSIEGIAFHPTFSFQIYKKLQRNIISNDSLKIPCSQVFQMFEKHWC